MHGISNVSAFNGAFLLDIFFFHNELKNIITLKNVCGKRNKTFWDGKLRDYFNMGLKKHFYESGNALNI